ncbi:MAG: hypothetical protein H7138_12410 [Myxococcales bacterium]|nr:hypothetical protein [Myxococcales bacterium]
MTSYYYLAAVAALVIAGAPRLASAQLISTARCANAPAVTQPQAAGCYAWANFCRNNPRPDATGVTLLPASTYLTQARINYYNADTDATEKANLFPTYFNIVTGGSWDVPDTAYWFEAPERCLQQPTTNATRPGAEANLIDTQCPLQAQLIRQYDCYALPTSAFNVGLCVAGCYTDDTALSFADGPSGIKAAAEAGKLDLVTLTPTATLDNLDYTANKVERYITDSQEAWQSIYTITMQSGGQLRVTSEHPLLDHTGVIRQAHALRVGDQLVRASGKPDPIARIESAKVFTKVYNVKPVTTDYVSNIVVAAGYLNGSLRYQNELLSSINALILRRSLAAQVDQLTN